MGVETVVKSPRICAGIVLFNPDIPLLLENVQAIINQVEVIYLFDNASKNCETVFDCVKKFPNVIYHKNEKNAGIAEGLDFLLHKANDDGFDWILTMDQDSVCADNLIGEYLKYVGDEKVALVSPFVLNNGKYTLASYKNLGLPEYEKIQNPINCITSACLTNVKTILKLGGFAKDFFIDGVDTELNCRVLQNNYDIIRANKTYLIQQMGKARKIPFFEILFKLTRLNVFRRIQVAAVYNDLRLFYFARNNYIIHKKYSNAGLRTSTPFMMMLFLYFTLTYPLSRSRISMWKSILKGYREARSLV